MRPLLVASVAIVIAAAAAPRAFDRFMEAGGHEAVARSPAADAGERRSHAASQTEIAVGRDGHFYVEAEINFRRIRLMVDTGATVVALRQSDAAAAGIRLLQADFDRPVSTANGTVDAAEAVLDLVRVRDIEVSEVRALVLPDDKLSVSLLGGSFLSRLARYEVSGGTLTFEN